jgi:hypothetical protein
MFSYEEINEEWGKYCLNNLLEIRLSWNQISRNTNININWNIIKINLDKSLDYNWLTENPNITFEIIKKNKDKYCYNDKLAINNFTLEKICFSKRN